MVSARDTLALRLLASSSVPIALHFPAPVLLSPSAPAQCFPLCLLGIVSVCLDALGCSNFLSGLGAPVAFTCVFLSR